MTSNVQNRPQAIIAYLGITMKEWLDMCKKKPELATLTPETIKRHSEQNSLALECSKEDWVRLCKSAPQLLEVNTDTLVQHKQENSEALHVTPKTWVRMCRHEPALLFINKETILDGMQANAKALGVTEEKWHRACLRRPALLVYKSDTLLKKVQMFVDYVKEPKKLVDAYAKTPEHQKRILSSAKGRVLCPKKVVEQFVKHPIAFLMSPEKTAYIFTYLSNEMKNFAVKADESAIFSYLDLSVEKLNLHHIYACRVRHQKKTVGMYHLAGAPLEVMKHELKTVAGVKADGDTQTLIDSYVKNCPMVQRARRILGKGTCR